MIRKKGFGIITLWALLATVNCFGQNFPRLEKELMRSYEQMQGADAASRFDSLSPRFRAQLLEVLSLPGSLQYHFDSLSLLVKKASSPDNKIRSFSYDERSGKANRTISTLVQFTDANSRVHTNIMSGNDVLYYEWHRAPVNGQMHYLSFGEGSRHPSTHLKRVNAFRLTEQGMVWVTGLFNWNPEFTDVIVLQAAKRKKIKLKYKQEKNMLIFRESIQTDFDGLKFKKGKKIRLTIQDGYFQRR